MTLKKIKEGYEDYLLINGKSENDINLLEYLNSINIDFNLYKSSIDFIKKHYDNKRNLYDVK